MGLHVVWKHHEFQSQDDLTGNENPVILCVHYENLVTNCRLMKYPWSFSYSKKYNFIGHEHMQRTICIRKQRL